MGCGDFPASLVFGANGCYGKFGGGAGFAGCPWLQPHFTAPLAKYRTIDQGTLNTREAHTLKQRQLSYFEHMYALTHTHTSTHDVGTYVQEISNLSHSSTHIHTCVCVYIYIYIFRYIY